LASRFIITGDIHLNLSNHASFEVGRFNQYIDTLCATGDEDTILVLNGDIFDKAKPTPPEVRLFYSAIEKLNKHFYHIYLVPGNHEEYSHKTTWYDYYPVVGFTLANSLSLPVNEDTCVHMVSHPNLSDILTQPTEEHTTNILFSHYRSAMGILTEEVDNAEVSKKYDYTILSDLHFHYRPYHNIEYTSAPYNIHYTEEVDNGFIELTILGKDFKSTYTPVYLPNKLKLTMSAKDYLKRVPTLSEEHFYKVTVKGSFDELKSLTAPYNVILNTVVLDADEEVLDESEVIPTNTVLDINEALIRLTIQYGGFPEDKFTEIGNSLLEDVVKETL
jgi:hypothetical protein